MNGNFGWKRSLEHEIASWKIKDNRAAVERVFHEKFVKCYRCKGERESCTNGY